MAVAVAVMRMAKEKARVPQVSTKVRTQSKLLVIVYVLSGFILFASILRRRLTRYCSCFVETGPIIVIIDDDDDPQAPDDDDIAVTPPVLWRYIRY